MRYIAVEFSKHQGREADNRPLLWDGVFGTGGQFSDTDVAYYPSEGAALRAAAVARNARPDCIVEAIAQGRRAHA